MTLIHDASEPMFAVSPVCRISGSSQLIDLISLGNQPLANSLKAEASEVDLRVPLTLSYCPQSSLVQLRETVRKEILFSSYVWVSGTSPTTREYAQRFASAVVDIAALRGEDLVVEIASNDGTFLKPFIAAGYQNVLGVDPARNIADMAINEGVPTIAEFWGKRVAEKLVSKYGKAKAIIARNVIAHVSNLQDVMAGVELALRDDGVGVFEFHSAGEILDGLQYDSIYHEHLCYFSLASMSHLLERFGLKPFHADFSPISGGALVVYFSKQDREPTAQFRRIEQAERDNHVNELETWQRFAAQCAEHRHKSIDLLSGLSAKRIVGFGSSARSSTYLNFCGFDRQQIAAVVDNNPLKQGRFTAGSSIPIVSLDEGLKENPDFVFIFAWNFRDEIMQSCRRAGYRGGFITAFPNEPRVWR